MPCLGVGACSTPRKGGGGPWLVWEWVRVLPARFVLCCRRPSVAFDRLHSVPACAVETAATQLSRELLRATSCHNVSFPRRDAIAAFPHDATPAHGARIA